MRSWSILALALLASSAFAAPASQPGPEAQQGQGLVEAARYQYGELSGYPLVLMYHEIVGKPDPQRNSESNVSLESFRKQLELLQKHGFTFISGAELVGSLKGGRPLPAKSVLITFDDGYLGNYKYAAPLMREMGVKGVFFVNPATIHAYSWLPHMTWPMVRELDEDELFEIGSHTQDHLKLDTLTGADLEYQFTDAISLLKRELGYTPALVAYPFGRHNRSVVAIAKKYHQAAFAVGTPRRLIHARYQIPRLSMTRKLGLAEFERRILAFDKQPKTAPLR